LKHYISWYIDTSQYCPISTFYTKVRKALFDGSLLELILKVKWWQETESSSAKEIFPTCKKGSKLLYSNVNCYVQIYILCNLSLSKELWRSFATQPSANPIWLLSNTERNYVLKLFTMIEFVSRDQYTILSLETLRWELHGGGGCGG